MTMLRTVVELLTLAEGAVIQAADGRTFTKDSSGTPTSNINWIAWRDDEWRPNHTNDVALPAEVAS